MLKQWSKTSAQTLFSAAKLFPEGYPLLILVSDMFDSQDLVNPRLPHQLGAWVSSTISAYTTLNTLEVCGTGYVLDLTFANDHQHLDLQEHP